MMHNPAHDRPETVAPPRPSGRLRPILVTAVTAVVAVVGALLGAAAPASAAAPTVVSVTFDDGNADQLAAAQSMNAKGLVGTFYVISGYVGQPGYLTRANLGTIAAAGNEIGGHTVQHLDLTTLPAADVSREVCNDRANLTNWGFPITSFAYPFASVNASVESAVEACGYNSARGLGDLKTDAGGGCPDCDNAETIPPTDPFLTRAADQVDATWTLDTLKKRVTDAEATGGWVQLTFHHICTGCGSDAADPTTTPALFDEFTTWLAAWKDGTTRQVATVNSVIGGAVKPLVDGPAPTPPPGPGENGTQNPSLETPSTVAGIPQCWWGSTFGTNSPVFSTVSPGHTGNTAGKVTMTNYVSGDAKLLAMFDQSGCAPSVTPGHTYSLRAFYTSTANTQFAVYTRDSVGAWNYWTSSPLVGPTSVWTPTDFTTPAVPVGATAISYGLNITANGELITDDYGLYDTVGAPPLALSAAVPTITGTAAVGATLTAVPGSWAPAPVTLSYAWSAGGTVIPGATSTTYTPKAADVGKTITVTVTGTKAGYTTQSTVSAATAAVTTTASATARLSGSDRYGTSAAISAATFAPGVAVAYVASGEKFPDALSGGAAAARLGGPVLLVQPNAVPASIATELARLKPAKIVVLGSTLSVSASVATRLGATAPVTRLQGVDRYATSAAISKAVFPVGVPVAYVASGANFPDALSGAAAAARLGGPVILVDPTSLPSASSTELKRLKPAKIVVLGSTLSVSAGVAASLSAIAPVTRQSGIDRYATSAAISAAAFTPGVSTVYVASGENFPDALSGSAAAGKNGGPVLIVEPNRIPASVATELSRLNPARIVVLGSELSVSKAVLTSLAAYIG